MTKRFRPKQGPRTRGARAARRRGMSYLLAMLYLVLFAAAALGFYAQTNLGAQVAGNERRVAAAQVAAESGLQFVRYQLSRVKVPPTVPREQVLEEVYNQLAAMMDGTGNLGPRMVGYTATPGARAINIPAGAHGFIPLGCNDSHFRATITELGGGMVRVKTTGRCGGHGEVARAIAMDFEEREIPSNVLSYGVAARSVVRLGTGVIVGVPDPARGSVLCVEASATTPVTVGSGGSSISGDVYIENRSGSVGGSGTIAGLPVELAVSAHVHAGVAAPGFPGVDPEPFVNYLRDAGQTLIASDVRASYLANVRVRAGANPTFSPAAGETAALVEGVVLIEAPNQVTFARGVVVRGVIVVANPTQAGGNVINFQQGGAVLGAETLPEQFGVLRTMKDTGILAPNFDINVNGGVCVVGGCVLATTVNLKGGANLSVDGSLVLTGDQTLSLSGGSTVTITGPAPTAKPVGFRYAHTYVPHPATYLEMRP